MSLIENFTKQSLDVEHIRCAILVFALALLSLCVIAQTAYSSEPKKRAWIISLFNSGAMTVIGIGYLAAKATTSEGVFPNDHSIFMESNVSILTCIWFAMANAVDLGFGIVSYRKYLDPLTAYVHHPVFIWIMITALTGNGGFIKVEPFTPIFLLVAIEELPTFLLALGYVFRPFRTDLGFGSTFFLFRILYHVFVMRHVVTIGVPTLVVVLFCLTLTLHIYWFTSWFMKYGVKLLTTKRTERDVKFEEKNQ